MHLNKRNAIVEYALSVLFAFALVSSAAASVEIVDFFSDFTSSDATVNSNQDLQGRAVFELVHSGSTVESHEVPISVKAGEAVTKVIIWQERPQYDYYTAKVSIYGDGKLLGSKTYPASYGTTSLPNFHIADFSPSNSGVQLLLQPFNPSAADIKIELLDNSDIIYTKTSQDVPLTPATSPVINIAWPLLLTNNENYTVRAKIYSHRLYAPPLINTYVAYFTATDDVEILPEDVTVDEFGASVTIRGKSQVPFDGSIVVLTKNRATGETQTYNQQLEDILVSGQESTAGVVWKGLVPGDYDIEILAVNRNNRVLDRYDTALRIPESVTVTQTPTTQSTPGFAALISILMILAASRRLKGR